VRSANDADAPPSSAGQLNIEVSEQLIAYLRERGRIGSDESPAVTVLHGGVSNRTVLVRRTNGEEWVLKQALGKLRVAIEWYSSPERIRREALGMQWLAKIAPAGAITPLLFEDHRHDLLAMRAVPQPHVNFKDELLANRIDLDLVEQFGFLLAAIHRGAQQKRHEFEPRFNDRTYFESLRLEPYYLYTAEKIIEARGFLHDLCDDSRAASTSIVHGDYSPKNILVHRGRLVLLDHEVIHFGDSSFDVGFSLAHLLSKANRSPPCRARFTDAAQAFWSTYAAHCEMLAAVDGYEQRAVRHGLACLLARVAGRSTLDYLDADARALQSSAALALMRSAPRSIPDLIQSFIAEIDQCRP
jgi:5-methylthioribose kinase